MQSTALPTLIPIPFAATGGKNTIPNTTNPTPGGADFPNGFPALTRTPIPAGGIPPAGLDMNGIFNAITAVQQWQNAGGVFKYDSAFSTIIGGYPKGAMLMSTDSATIWLNLAEDNTTNPDSGGAANWVTLNAYGAASVSGLTNANVTLTPAQYGKSIIVLSGTLTGNIQIIFPTASQQWLVINNTTGAFSVTCKTASGTGGVVSQGGGQQFFWGNGTNLNPTAGNSAQGLLVGAATTAVQAPQIGQIPGKNKIIGGHFVTNQTAYTSGTALAIGAYAFDLWKSSTTNSSMTFTPSPQGQQVTVVGSFQQVLERPNIAAGQYTLSWVGTAQARVYNFGSSAPAYASSPITVALDGTQNVVTEYTNGTLDFVQFEAGTMKTAFEQRFPSAEIALAQRYLYVVNFIGMIGTYGGPSTFVSLCVSTPTSFRSTPIINLAGLTMTVSKSGVGVASTTNATTAVVSTTSNALAFSIGGNWTGLAAGDSIVVTATPGVAVFDARL